MELLANIEVNEQQSQGECGGYEWHQQIVEEIRSRILEIWKENRNENQIVSFSE